MQAIILAAGEGVRMRPLTLTKPKPLLEVAGKPLIRHTVEALPSEATELIIVVGYLGDQIKAYCGENFLGRAVQYVHQVEKKGTADALKLCQPLLRSGKFLIAAAPDDILDPEAWCEALQYDLCIITSTSDHPEKFGVLILHEDGSVKDFIEKPENFISNIINTNNMVLDERIFNYQPDPHPNGEFYLTTMVSKLAREHKVNTVVAKTWIPVATPEDLQKAEDMLSSHSN